VVKFIFFSLVVDFDSFFNIFLVEAVSLEPNLGSESRSKVLFEA